VSRAGEETFASAARFGHRAARRGGPVVRGIGQDSEVPVVSSRYRVVPALVLAAFAVGACADDPQPSVSGSASRVYPTAFAGDGLVFEDLQDAGSEADGVVAPDLPDAASPDVAVDVELPDLPEDSGPTQTTAAVSHTRELRAVWVATVWNINFPSRAGLSASQLRAELVELVDVTASAGLNAIVFQARAEGDAFYASALEPWSRFLTGTQGGDPGLDPLAELVALAHARNIEVHAWLNPYRAKTQLSSALAANHLAALHPQYAYTYGSLVWLDPAAEPVQQRLIAVVEDLVTRYDVDGIHFDDYFYPYPDGPFPDGATYAAYQAAGGSLGRDDWRRDNVNRLVAAVFDRIQALDPACRFGIAPFGIYRPGQPEGITGLDQYAAIFADPVQWMRAGKVHYIAPQLYWPTTRTRQAYEPLLRWWTEVQPGAQVFAGNYLSQLGTAADWTIAEFREQLRISRAQREGGSLGNIWYQIDPLISNDQGIRDVFRDEFYPAPALTPPMPGAASEVVPPPAVTAEQAGGDLTLTILHAPGVRARAAAVYRANGGAWLIDRLVPAATGVVTLPAAGGPYAVSTVDRRGAESLGVVAP
jgi:uncharacterized lipoprotein YddW (UPF0748 family)